jgi:hypothetical protein
MLTRHLFEGRIATAFEQYRTVYLAGGDHQARRRSELLLIPLHSQVAREEQSAIFRPVPYPDRQRKVRSAEFVSSKRVHNSVNPTRM